MPSWTTFTTVGTPELAPVVTTPMAMSAAVGLRRGRGHLGRGLASIHGVFTW